MSAAHFIKNNLALVTGLAVPVLLVIGFLASTQLARSLTEPPAHIAYFAVTDYQDDKDASTHLDIEAKDGRITTTLKAKEQHNNNNYPVAARTAMILAFDAAKGSVTEIKIKRPEDFAEGVFDAPELAGVSLASSQVAPDGYQVVYRGYGSTIATDIFIGGRSHGYRLKKGSASYKLPEPKDKPGTPYYRYYYNDIRFLGWSAQPASAQGTTGEKQ